MRCVLCGRKLFKAALQVGSMAIGPKCAKRAGMIVLKRRKKEAERDELTLDLFDTPNA